MGEKEWNSGKGSSNTPANRYMTSGNNYNNNGETFFLLTRSSVSCGQRSSDEGKPYL